jgi:diguanylate cyclase (GGDEF)-like protein
MDPALIAALAAAGGLVLGFAAGALAFRRKRSGETAKPPNPPEGDLVDGHRPPDWRALSCQFLGLVRQAVGAEGAVCLVPGGEGWRVSATNPGLKAAESVPRRDGLAVLAFEGEQEVAAESVHPQVLGYLPGRTDPVAWALAPVVHRGKARALLSFHRAAGKPFRPEEVALMARAARTFDAWEGFAAHFHALSARSDEGERLARGLEQIVRQKEPDAMAGFVLDHLFDLLPALYAFTVIRSPRFQYAYIETKKFEAPETFRYMDRQTWAYWVLMKGGEPLYLEGAASRDTAMPILFRGEPFPPGAVAYLHPLSSGDEQFGIIGVVGRESQPFPEVGRKAAGRFIEQVAALLHLALLQKHHEKFATLDGLTGLYNRRHFDAELPKELSRSQREGKPLSLLMVDLDHFKKINDSYGHPAGDLVLKETAHRMQAELRDIDLLCRYGGEEFVIILPGCPPGEAVAVAERIRRSVESLPWGGASVLPSPVTVSVGVASFPRPFGSLLTLLKGADEALYQAKNRGRNRVAASGG